MTATQQPKVQDRNPAIIDVLVSLHQCEPSPGQLLVHVTKHRPHDPNATQLRMCSIEELLTSKGPQ